MAKMLNRSLIKSQVREQLKTAQVAPKGMTAFYMALAMVLNVLVFFCDGAGLPSMFLTILANLLSIVLDAGFILYCFAVCRNERFEYLSLFDGFSFTGKLVLLYLIRSAYTFLWSMLFVIPGIIATYRYRFAVYNLCENPDLSVTDALRLSVQQTYGYKMQLFNLDMSYLGWTLLSMLPMLVTEVSTFISSADFLAYMSTPSTLPAILLQGGWSLMVSLFYYPNYICANLVYFESAKTAERASGSPDGLGGI